MTIRRDLDVLADSGLVDKVHGGATARGHLSTDEPGFEAKSHRQLAEKEAIARAARRLVEPGPGDRAHAPGTTTWRLAHHLADVPDLTVVTNSIQVAIVLHREAAARPHRRADRRRAHAVRRARRPDRASTTLRSLHVDMLFMGVHGMAEDSGFTTPNLLEAETNRALIASAERVVVVADHTKWGVRGLSRIAQLGEADVLVTDRACRPRRTTRSPATSIVSSSRRRAARGEARRALRRPAVR